MSGERYLIVNADDFGRSPGINTAIVRCRAQGIVSSTTLMVNLAWTEDAVGRLGECPGLGVGLHLNCCYGRPVARPEDVPSLIDRSGTFVTDTGWLARNACYRDIEIETLNQLRRFECLVGSAPTHMDSHKYLHSTSRFRRPVMRVALAASLPLRSVTPEDRAVMRRAGIRTPDRFEGRFHEIEGEGVSPDVLWTALQDVPPGVTELMCHPGFVDKHLRDSSYARDRELEVEALCDVRTVHLIEELGIRVKTFAELDQEMGDGHETNGQPC